LETSKVLLSSKTISKKGVPEAAEDKTCSVGYFVADCVISAILLALTER
jgi:hypothetical protein